MHTKLFITITITIIDHTDGVSNSSRSGRTRLQKHPEPVARCQTKKILISPRAKSDASLQLYENKSNRSASLHCCSVRCNVELPTEGKLAEKYALSENLRGEGEEQNHPRT